MTDYQFRSIVKMIYDIVDKSKDVEEIKRSLNRLLDNEGSNRGKESDS